MSDHAYRMFSEAQGRLHDADILAQSLDAVSDSQAFLRILAFEVLLKCALVVIDQKPKHNHKYKELWSDLPAYAQQEVLAVASERMPGYADLTRLEKLLDCYQYVFEKARYHYEIYERYTLEEQHELGQLWLALGAPTEEAVVQYYPAELQCLIAGLSTFIEARLPNPPVASGS